MQIITNADDLGISAEKNGLTFELIAEGLVTSATVLANAPFASEACLRARDFPRCSFGVHWNLTCFKPLSASMPPRELLDHEGCLDHGTRHRTGLHRYRDFIFSELCAQIDFLQARGLGLSHLDSHHHVHTRPVLLPVLHAVRHKYGIMRARISRNLYSISKPASRLLLLKKTLFNAALRRWCRFRTTDGFTDLETFVQRWPDISTKFRRVEIMLHPGAPGSVNEVALLRDLAESDQVFRRGLVSYHEL